jgi:hypothetical protein
VTDNAGNTDDCVASVFVNDLLSPTIGCPPAFVVNAGPACTANVPSLIFTKTATVPPLPKQMEFWDNAFDPCGLTADYQLNGGEYRLGLVDNVNSTINLSGIIFGAGTNTVTLRLTDRANNLTACTFTVTVADVNGPVTATVRPISPNPPIWVVAAQRPPGRLRCGLTLLCCNQALEIRTTPELRSSSVRCRIIYRQRCFR